MKKIVQLIVLASITFLLTNCNPDGSFILPGLSETEIATGLKEALKVGTDTTVVKLVKSNAYYNDALIKLLLPKEINDVLSVVKNSNSTLVTNLYSLTLAPIELNMIRSLNAAAEDAANNAKPIFVNAITTMSITDAVKILKGNGNRIVDDTAATNYLRQKTFNSLAASYRPKIDSSLDKTLLLGKSTNSYYQDFTDAYNSIANNQIVQIVSPLQPIGANTLGDYATKKALNGLFLKVSDEEKSIRKDPLKRVNDILKKVFAGQEN